MKKIIFLLLFLISYYCDGQIKLNQIQPCKVNGVLTDSCFIMTNSLGIQTYVPYSTVVSMGGGQITDNGDGTYTYTTMSDSIRFGYTCNITQDTIIRIYNEQGTLASTCSVRGMYKAIKTVAMNTDTTLIFTNVGGQVFTVPMCPFVRNCQTTTTLTYDVATNNLEFTNELGIPQTINLNESNIVNRTNGSYTHTNQKGDTLNFGYKLSCVNDSTITLTDQDGTTVTTCVIKGGASGDAVTLIELSPDTVLHVTYSSGAETDIDLCPVVKTCETKTIFVNKIDGSYDYYNEDGTIYTVGYKFKTNEIPTNGYLYLTDQDGTKVDSVDLCGGNCPPLAVTAVNDTFTSTVCTYISGVLNSNDTECNKGLSTYSYVQNSGVGGFAMVDANGNFTYYFTNCLSGAVHSFSYMVCCKDGVCDFADVIITPPSCGGGVANLDLYSLPRATTLSFNVAANDAPCTAPKLITYSLLTTTYSGALYLPSNGQGTYSPLPSFQGRDSAIVQILCDGTICDTAYLKFNVIASSVYDDFYSLVNGGTRTGLNNTSNDVACSSGVTTYAWYDSLYPLGVGNIIGTNPSSYNFYASTSFCGVAHRQYAQYCDAVLSNVATAYFYVSCGNAIDDIYESSDTLISFDVSNNDNWCTNGGITTFHLINAMTTSGTGLSYVVEDCLGDNCPGGTPYATGDARITTWDTTNGHMKLGVKSDFSGDVCFKYVLKCKSGGTVSLDTACVHIIREVAAMASLQITNPDTLQPVFQFRMGGYCMNGNNKVQLKDGDHMKLYCPTANGNIDVELIVGQNIKTGYTNDVGGYWAAWCVPSVNSVILSKSALLGGVMTFTFRKDTFAKKSQNWGDGIVNVNRIGQELLWSNYVRTSDCGGSTAAIDTMPKCYDIMTTYHWNFSQNTPCNKKHSFAYNQTNISGSFWSCGTGCKAYLQSTEVGATSEIQCYGGGWVNLANETCNPYNTDALCYCMDGCTFTGTGRDYAHRGVVKRFNGLSNNINYQDTIYTRGYNGDCPGQAASTLLTSVYSCSFVSGHVRLNASNYSEGGGCGKVVTTKTVRVCTTPGCGTATTSPIVFSGAVAANQTDIVPIGRYTTEGKYKIWTIGSATGGTQQFENNVFFYVFSF